MTSQDFESQLDHHGISFYWYAIGKFWWVRKTGPDGKHLRSIPAGAKNREAAEMAAIKFIRRQFRNNP